MEDLGSIPFPRESDPPIPIPVRDKEPERCTEEEMALWGKFDKLRTLHGFTNNIVAVLTSEDVPYSKMASTLTHEMDFARQICIYLCLNGIRDVCIDSNFEEQTALVDGKRDKRHKDISMKLEIEFEPEDTVQKPCEVTVLVLFPVSGPWRQKIMFEKIQMAFKNSTMGVVIIANKEITQEKTQSKWGDFLTHMEKNFIWKPSLEIICLKHGVMADSINSASELKAASPAGGCRTPCGRMACGHTCGSVCHPFDFSHKLSQLFVCKEPCLRVCKRGHHCRKTCHENCGECYFVVTLNGSCAHKTFRDAQEFCFNLEKLLCKEPVEKELLCGHKIMVPCHMSKENLQIKCNQEIQKILECGHEYSTICSSVPENIKCPTRIITSFICGHKVENFCHIYQQLVKDGTKLKCNEKCTKSLPCGHPCPGRCHPEVNHENVKCIEKCEKVCKRGAHRCSANHTCGEPCPPCEKMFEFHLACGHCLNIPCEGPDPDENTYKCEDPCLKINPFCNHPCKKMCFEECGLCRVKVRVRNALCTRGHFVEQKCGDRSKPCEVLIHSPTKSSCGHTLMVKCHEADNLTVEELASRCTSACNARFDEDKKCGHRCYGNCKKCFQGRFHARCDEPCDKILICGHTCHFPCNMVCPPCTSECEIACGHKKCKKFCGVPCELDCEEPCLYFCEHSRCTKKCKEVCDRRPCKKPCNIVLGCGHPCVGFCGEICPPYCRVCDPDELSKCKLIGRLDDDGPGTDRFIYLSGCNHCVEVNELDTWIASTATSNEVLPFRCPHCRTRINWLHRYSSYFHEYHNRFQDIKKRLFGSDEEIQAVLKETKETILNFKVNRTEHDKLEAYYIKALVDELDEAEQVERSTFHPTNNPIDLHMAKFLKWITNEFIEVCYLVDTFQGMTNPTANDLRPFWKAYLWMLFHDREWPLHPNELFDAWQERQRLEDGVSLFSQFSQLSYSSSQQVALSITGQRMFKSAIDILRSSQPYTASRRAIFQEKVEDINRALTCTLNVTEKERLDIVGAFGSRTGRWFKCPNGHLYVITECGGATEVGTCNECGAQIGGENHQLIQRNYLGTEMDHALEPLYPTMLDRDE